MHPSDDSAAKPQATPMDAKELKELQETSGQLAPETQATGPTQDAAATKAQSAAPRAKKVKQPKAAVPAEPIRVIVGLGNPTAQYHNTRHNVGFWVLDQLARQWGVEFKVDAKRKAMLASANGVLLVKPLTYMNLSGESVGPLMRFFKLKPASLLVIYDEINLPTAALRYRMGGSAGGQKGMQSIIGNLGTTDIPRLRIGIGPRPRGELSNWVLGKFSTPEQAMLENRLAIILDSVQIAVERGVDSAANFYNAKDHE